jgi:hypothetical protein
MLEVVVSRYKEDIAWTSDIRKDAKITVYNKFFQESNPLSNVGREPHTYLYHIINNYDNLEDYTAFLQGHPFDHDPDILSKINNFNITISDNIMFFGPMGMERMNACVCDQRHPHGLPIYYFFDLLFGLKAGKYDHFNFFAGAQFVVHKNTIQNRPKKFYEFLMKFLSYDVHPIEGYIIERLWLYIMSKKILLSNKYLSFV